MLKTSEIVDLAETAARAALPPGVVVRVLVESTVSSVGEDALRVLIVLAPNSIEKVDGDAVVSALVQIQQSLESAGDDRLAIVQYATEADLADVGD